MDQGREDGLRRRCSVREPPVRGGEESIPAGTRLLAPPPHALCRLISLSIMLSSSIHAVANGFESILEGLYGPRLRRHLSLFEDCEPEELTDWSMDEKCSLCNLQREAVSDCIPSLDSSQSTPTEELSSQGQFNTEKIECQAENYLNALFQKKGPAHPRSSKSHIVSLHLLLSFLAVTTPFQIHEWNNDAGKGKYGEHKLEKMLQISLAVKKQREAVPGGDCGCQGS
ncbi:uncharacterized protein LOC118667020 isoform X5 [Myotis myotis]|uniref:uncharacterized protein LOC118667020 isoform X5 n=1 Tax=Myotis myotis TaxID=51298 RepID=UPI00174C02A9|nr:uncharacterized protein LOC118667020 isoform X5 [Myotis myotis]